MDLRQVIRDVPDFPKPGILFRDITPVMADPEAYKAALAGLKDLIVGLEFDSFGAIESRGFIFGGPLAVDMDRPMVLMRKAGKLPADTYSVSYDLEYGEATLEIHKDGFGKGDRVVIVDDLLATGGTAAASARLVELAGGRVAGFLFLVELNFLKGRELLERTGPVYSLVRYD